jgi:hypothetical protein
MTRHTLKYQLKGPLGIAEAISLGEQLRAVPDDVDITIDLRQAKPTSPWAIAALIPALGAMHRTLTRSKTPWVYTLAAHPA